MDLRGTLMQVRVQPGGTFSSTTPVKLLDSVGVVSSVAYRPWDISRDGKRFLMLRPAGAESSGRSALAANLIVTVNWTEELKARLPAK